MHAVVQGPRAAAKVQCAPAMKNRAMTLMAIVVSGCLPPTSGATEVSVELMSESAISVALSSPAQCASLEGISVELGGVPALMDQVGAVHGPYNARCQPAIFTLSGKPAIDLSLEAIPGALQARADQPFALRCTPADA